VQLTSVINVPNFLHTKKTVQIIYLSQHLKQIENVMLQSWLQCL